MATARFFFASSLVTAEVDDLWSVLIPLEILRYFWLKAQDFTYDSFTFWSQNLLRAKFSNGSRGTSLVLGLLD
jgi:hypothetical protein